MQFMAPVTVPCETCQGHRFRPEVLAVRYNGRNISEALELTVETALEFFADQKRLVPAAARPRRGRPRLPAARAVHLDALGRRGAAAQARELPRPLPAAARPRLFLFDEPTTGLHLADIDLLYHTLRRLVQRGDGVVVVEHSPDLIARSDWIVDMGPGGGIHGGEVPLLRPAGALPRRGGRAPRRTSCAGTCGGPGRHWRQEPDAPEGADFCS